MNVRELLLRDQGIEVRISGGTGHRDDPYVVDCDDPAQAAATQMLLLRGLGHGMGVLWRTIEWTRCDVGRATEVIRIETVRFEPEEIVTQTRALYFDTRTLRELPPERPSMIAWRAPQDPLCLPYELGWLHFESGRDNGSTPARHDHSVYYGGLGAKMTLFVYGPLPDDVAPATAYEREFERAASAVRSVQGVEDPWPAFRVGPFTLKAFLAGNELSILGLARSASGFVKLRLTHVDDLKMRELMQATLIALSRCVGAPETL